MSSKSSSLNLWGLETKDTKFDVDCHDDRVDFTVTGSQKLVFAPVCDIGAVSDVSAKILAMEATQIADDSARASEIATNVAGLASEVVSRQSGDAALSAQVGQEVSDRSASHVQLQANIDAEQTRSEAKEAVIDAAITQEVADRTASVQSEVSRAVQAEQGLQQSIDALASVDTTTLAQIQQVIIAYGQADTSMIQTLQGLETRLQSAENTLSALTSP
jgi:hypothetical protein